MTETMDLETKPGAWPRGYQTGTPACRQKAYRQRNARSEEA